ncbi:uncharacterized protein EAF02_004641 [Botrytis sinoallii]|uniref:uncharacterized protein n=1 Tax=Botrytis sinoallii TaxID=1463999 RepID=UPI0019002C17|nr:uncharacterized protein EAF02_004641 [Botrytis sinoallii]KAF7884305.1 hypothetical protein EAF02_004641 [Botrytis sinoallii]
MVTSISRPSTPSEAKHKDVKVNESSHILGVSGVTSALRDLNLKYPNDKLKLVPKKNELWFKCHDCPAKLYKVAQSGSRSAFHADRVTRNGETTITTRYVQKRKEKLKKIRGKDPISSRWTWWLDENQAPKSRNGNFANVKSPDGTLAKNGDIAGPSKTQSYPEGIFW